MYAVLLLYYRLVEQQMSMTTVIHSLMTRLSMTLSSPVQTPASLPVTGVAYYSPLVLMYMAVEEQEELIPVLVLFIVFCSLLVLVYTTVGEL